MRRTALVVPLLLLCCSCAVMDEENRHLVPWVEDHLVPETTVGKVLAAPVVLPVGVAAGILDAFIFHPITVVDDAYEDTADALWRDSRLDYVAQCGSLPFKTAATPVVFVVDFAGRAMFDFSRRGRYRSVQKDELAEFREGIASEDRATRLRAMRRLDMRYWPGKMTPVFDALLDACAKHEKDAELCALAMAQMLLAINHLDASQVQRLLPVARRLAARKEPDLRRYALRVVNTLSRSARQELSTSRPDAVRALISLYDLYVAEKDYVSEAACCEPMGSQWRRGRRGRGPGLAFPRHVLASLRRRKWPVHMTLAAYVFQATVLDNQPKMYPTAVKEGWLVVRVRPDWPQRLGFRAAVGRQRPDRAEAVRVAREVVGVREPTGREVELLLAYPHAILPMVEAAQKKGMEAVAAAELQRLIARLRTEISVVDLLEKVTELPKEQADAFRELHSDGEANPRQFIKSRPK